MDEASGDGEGKAGGGSGAGVEEDMEVGDCSEEEEEEEEDMELGSSPIADQSNMMGMQSPALPYEGLASPLRVGPVPLPGGKPVAMRRGPGRPRTRGGVTQPQVRTKRPVGLKLKRWKGLLVSGVYGTGNGKSTQEGEAEESTSPVQPSTPVEQVKTPIFVDEPLFSEQWPGKICVLCNLSEHSQLGQGEMLRIESSVEDLPKDLPRDLIMSPPETLPLDSTSPRQPLQSRRQKGPSKCRNSGTNGQEPVDELSLVGHIDIPEPTNIVDSGYIYIHEWCAGWCSGVTRSGEKRLENVAVGVMAAVSRRCYHCSRYGAGAACVVPSCNKHFHTPCAAAAATFQHPKTLILICSQHIDHVTTMPELGDVTCQSCDTMGNPANLVMCSICGNHHHGACIGNALHPGLRSGWQCSDCRICQLCRVAEETNRMLLCEACDKAYHPYCVKPAMSSVPKVGWKCKRCRLCSDCGARTPGGGLSSRWHSNYTVCDSCYQQRNKGFSCPVCHKAYRAAALREMVRCSQCQRFVHGTCDKEADFVSYHRKKEAHPDYQYICLACKNNTTDKLLVLKRKDSTEEATLESNLSVSQESLVMGDDDLDSEKSDEAPLRLTIGLGKGKPFCASKMAKKRLGLGVGPGRPKGSGKMSAISPLSHYQKRSRFAEFGRKRGAKPKMRGIFGVPGLGLQRPQSDNPSKTEDEPGGENKLVLCSSKDKFVLGQDMCVMCGSLGIDQEACLIACAQCGQCYHPYCVSVKVTKVMLQKGWRCLDCTVCEGCGQRNDEGRLILCDDCDISYHIYCMDPPLGAVPTGVWKCKWCAQCQTCGANSPGVNSNWQSNCTQCGPCSSRTSCPACLELYTDGDLIIKCINCDRWLHCLCDTITNEQEAEACCAQGYTCVLCRPSNVALVVPAMPVRAPSPELIDGKMSAADYYVDGVCLSEVGLQQIKILSLEHNQQPVRRKRPGFKRPQEADILATIESVVAGDAENGEGGKDSVYKDGMIWGSKESGPVPSPPEGFTLYTMESGVVILKRKKQRNLQKLGIGGFSAVKMRSSRFKDDEEGFMEDKPRRKPRCNKKKSKLAESYPSYLQEAFFGKDLLDTSKETNQDLESSSDDSDEGKTKVTHDKTITLSQDELKVLEEVKAKREHLNGIKTEEETSGSDRPAIKEEEGSDGQALKDILRLPDNLLHTDLVNTIMNERDGEIKTENLMSDSALPESQQLNESGSSQKDELSDILGPHFNIESMVRETGLPNMDSKDVEEIFKGVLTDESQESQSSGVFPMRGTAPSTPAHQQLSPQPGVVQGMGVSRPTGALPSVAHSNLSSPGTFPSASPYNSEYSNSPQFSPEGSPWGGDDNGVSYNQRTSIKMESDEALGQSATISAVLYANVNHPEWRTEFPDWSERCKQILRKWRALPSDKKAPYLQQARENRTNLRIRKAQQIGKESAAGGGTNEKQATSGKSFEEQDKVQTAKSTREAEQERQWKQLQAMRQQQLLSQTRAQGVTKITRQVSGDGSVVQYTTDQGNTQTHLTQLQVSTSQEANSVTGVSPRGPLFTSPVGALKVTPRVVAPNTSVFPRVLRPPTPSPFSPPRQPIPEEMNRQLRDLLQRQHAKHGNNEGSQLLSPVVNSPLSAGGQLRQPIPQPRPQTLQHHTTLQGVDARVRLLLQQQRANFTGGQVRLAAPRSQVDQFGLIQRTQFQHITAQSSAIVRNTQPIVGAEQVRLPQPTVEQRIPAGREGEEIPDSVTAELEKLEQEGGNIAEVEAVSAILGDLVEDDDELLAEMGADFNILEYADPELDNVAGGEKTNIFDDLEDEVEKKKQSSDNRSDKNKPKREDVIEIKNTNKSKEKSVIEKENKPLVAEPVSSSNVVTIVSTPTSMPSQLTPQASLTGGPGMPQNAGQFAAPTNPLPRLPIISGGVQPTRAQVPQVLSGGQNQFIQIPPPPPPYPGPPPPYPGQQIRVGAPSSIVPRPSAPGLPPPQRRSLLLQEQPLLLEDLLEEEKRELEKQAATPAQNSSAALMSDAEFERLRADVLGTNSQVSSPPSNIQGVALFNAPLLAAPPLPPENIVTEQDKQAQVQYEQWLHSNNAVVSQQLKYYETEVQKLRKIRKSLNSKQRQLRKNGNELSQRDALELQRVTGDQTVLQKHLEAARKQSRQHSMVMQEYQSKQEQKPNSGGGSVVTSGLNLSGNSSPHSPALMSPGVASQPPQPSPQVSPLHHSPRIGTPQSQGGDDKNDGGGLPSPRPPPMVPTPPSPQQFTQIRHPGMVPRFARSPEGGMRPRMLVTQVPGQSSNQIVYNAPRVFTSSPQPISSASILSQNTSNQTIRLQAPQGLSAQHQQLLLQRQQLQQQKQQLLQQQQDLNQEVASKQMQEGMQRPILQQRQLSQEETLTRQQQLHMLQRQQQLAQQNRQQLLLSQQGKVGQFRQILQQNQQSFSQNAPIQSQSPLGHLQAGSPIAQSPMVTQAQSPVPQSPIGSVQQFNPSSSPLHPQSPMLSQFQTSSSPMPQHSPRVSYQTSNSPMTPQSPMVYSGLQTPNSPMPQFNQPISPMPPQSPRVQQYNQQPPSPMTPQSPMLQQQFVHRPNSPMPPRSPMPPMGSPMPMRRPSSTGGSVGSSPATERPQSVENPRTPQDHDGGGGGGGNPNNPMNPIPFPPGFGRFGYFKLGLRGGSPMWSGKTPPRKQIPKGGKVADSLAGSSSHPSDDHTKVPQKEAMAQIHKVASLVCVDYNDFDDESRTPPMTPPAKPALIKKAEAGTPKTRQSEDTDSELTVYDDIVLVESCKETNLEVEELQSALEGNVMSTVVSMPMVIDPGHIQMMDVESDLLDDCLVGSTDLVVLDVENGSAENECILEVVDKESDDILILEGNGIEEGLKVDDSELIHNSEELMDLEEDTPSPPVGRKRMIGKVLPGESIMKEEEKHTSDSPDSPEEDLTETSPEPYLHQEHDSETISPIKEEKIESYKVEQMNKISKPKYLQKQDDIVQEDSRNMSTIQPNVVVSRPAVTFTPVVTQKTLPICTERRLSRQQATVASLVQNAVNAAKLAAEQRAAANNNSSGDITMTSNVITSSILTTPNSTNVSLHQQFLPLAVLSKNDKHVGMIDLKKEHELHRTSESIHSRIQISLSEKIAAERKSLEEDRNENMRKIYKSDSGKFCETDMKSDKANDIEKRDVKIYERDKKQGSEKVDDSMFDLKFTKPPWEHSHFNLMNHEKSKPEEMRSFNDKRAQFKTHLKLDLGDKKDKLYEQGEDKISSDKGNVSLPCVTMSPSILEAQLTSMLRTSEQNVAQKFVYTLINRSTANETKKDSNQIKDHDIHDEMRVEGLAAQFHKSEELKLLSEIKKMDAEESRNSKVQPTLSMKHGNIYVNSQIKSDTVMVGGKSYKIFQAGPQASTSDILNIRENITINKNETSVISKTEESKIINSTENQQRAEILKNFQFSDKSHDNKLYSQNERRNSLNENRMGGIDILQQRIVSSSESSHIDKETHHVSFNAAKALQKEEPKKFLPLSTMLMQKKENDDKGSRFPLPRTPEDSQNVLLKQLLQNTACATTTAPQTAPPLPIVPSLEAQLARPVPPTPSSLLPPVLNEPPKPQPQKENHHLKIQQPIQEQCRVSSQPSLDELLSPPPTQLQPPPPPPPPPPPHQSPVKREPVILTQPGPVMTPMIEVKKEPPPLTSPVVVEVKKEVVSSDEMLSPGLKTEPEHPGEAALQDLKKQKRRQYQQKRRQSLGKETIGGTPKKRPRKSSKVEEDYDSFIDSLMLQLRQTPAMTICEPNLTYNFTACPIFGSGDLSKVNSSTRFGELKGIYGNAYLPNENDYYNTLPFGDLPPRAPATPSTQRGFYNEEFAPLKLHSTKDEFDEKKFDYNRDRDNDTPDTIISSSSPECIMPETPHRFPGLQLIDSDNEEDKMKLSRYSPEIPIIAPLALRAKPARLYSDMDKENEGPHGKRHCDVTVTLTLSSQASDDVLSVLRNLANVLRIPVPVNYSITERTLMQPSQKLGLYRFKGKDGKEGVPVDIQSILNGAAKFCRHCDMIILNNLMRKKASEMPLVAKQGEEDLYFCSSACYMQVALTHPSIQNEKAIPIVEPKSSLPTKKIKLETSTESEPIKNEVKKDSPDSDISESSLYMGTRGAGKRDKLQVERIAAPFPLKKSPSRYRIWTSNSIPPPSARHKKPTDKEITEMLFRLGITVQPPKLPDDVRTCLFCHQIGDGVTDGPARLLNFDVNKWVHLNCALWSDEVYETVSGGLVNVELALQNGITVNCAYCNSTGATLKCYKMRCSLVYHLPCAVKDQCVFYKNKTLYCSSHVPKCEKENELTTLSVMRRVYVSRDENRQVASIMHHSEQTSLMRIGSLIFLSVGQLLPHQLQAFHTPNYIYPIGYKILRMYWSMKVMNKRCRYTCSIHEVDAKPEFRILVQERGEPDLEMKDKSARGVWLKVLEPLTEKRKTESSVQLFTKFITGEDLFGLTEPAIVRVLESLPGVESLTDYRFKYGRNPLLELPLAINPSGCARSEGRPKGHWKRAHTQRTCSVSLRPFAPSTPLSGEAACPYSKQFVHSKSSQYKKMKQEWRNNVYLARSKIQGLGLYAARDLERHTMVIEYIGEIIRTELAETREKQYEAKNRGIYMFRLDEDRVVDATLSGGLARYINHSCSPNCVAETVEVDRDVRIIIFTKRRINRGEELAYDYKFDIEDDQHKIPCNCGAPNCRKWMN